MPTVRNRLQTTIIHRRAQLDNKCVTLLRLLTTYRTMCAAVLLWTVLAADSLGTISRYTLCCQSTIIHRTVCLLGSLRVVFLAFTNFRLPHGHRERPKLNFWVTNHIPCKHHHVRAVLHVCGPIPLFPTGIGFFALRGSNKLSKAYVPWVSPWNPECWWSTKKSAKLGAQHLTPSILPPKHFAG